MTDKANEQRGEFEIELGGATYGMRPTWEAIEAIEGYGMTLTELAFKASNGMLPIAASAIVVTECIRAFGRAKKTSAQSFQLEKVKPLVMEAGTVNVQLAITPMLTLALTGGLTSSGERKPSATEKTEETKDADVSKVSPAARSTGSRGSSGRARR